MVQQGTAGYSAQDAQMDYSSRFLVMGRRPGGVLGVGRALLILAKMAVRTDDLPLENPHDTRGAERDRFRDLADAGA